MSVCAGCFYNVAICFKDPSTQTKKSEQNENMRGKIQREIFDQNHLTWESFATELFSETTGQVFPDKTNSSLTFSSGVPEFDEPMRDCNLGNNLLINVPPC